MILPLVNTTALGAILAGRTTLGAFGPIDQADKWKPLVVL
jgi:hypothetical protein